MKDNILYNIYGCGESFQCQIGQLLCFQSLTNTSLVILTASEIHLSCLYHSIGKKLLTIDHSMGVKCV